jgi:hypothetical protein
MSQAETRVEDLTTDEIIRVLFPDRVIEQAKRLAAGAGLVDVTTVPPEDRTDASVSVSSI